MNPRAPFPLLTGFTLTTLSLIAQDRNAPPTDHQTQTGTITGRVLCGDTRSPARLATVLIIPIPVFDATGKPTLPQVKDRDIARTNLDGDYTLSKIAPGDYFVLAELRGYLSPVSKFRWTDVHNMTPDSFKNLSKLLPSVHVEPGKTSHAEVVLDRGASISGKVIYDDGSPAIELSVSVDPVEDLENDHQFINGMATHWALVTDDHGRYRLDGLPAGEYVVEATLGGTPAGDNPLWNGDAPRSPSPELAYPDTLNTTYAEKTLHKKDAKVYKLEPGEDQTDADIEIPLHGLYSISGTVTAQVNQPPFVFGFVLLKDLDDKTFIRSTVIHTDGSFQLHYLPPGKYQLKTVSVSDQSPVLYWGQERKPSYHYPETNTKVEVIDGDLTDIRLRIPEAPSSEEAAKPVTSSQSH